MVGTSIGLFMMHKRSRAKKLREIREYFREQTTYRNSIITMHSNAKSRISMYSLASTGEGSRGGSLSQFGGLGRDSIDEENSDRRGLLARGSSDGPSEHSDSDDEGAGHPTGNSASARRASRLREEWNADEFGA